MSDKMPKGAINVWLVGLFVYLLAVFHRSSLAVAGLEASDRFGITASQLSIFAMLQLAVYAGMQIPVGLMLDRFGSRRLLSIGVVTLTLAQVTFALADTYALALVARVCVGLGDAMTFVCVLRLVNTWFLPRQIPMVTQLTGVLGQLGAIIAAVPMTLALSNLGWTKSYLLAASLGIFLLIALLVFVHDSPQSRSVYGPQMSVSVIRKNLGESWAHPGTRLGFWTHFSTQFSATAFGLLWGYPFLVSGEGLTSAEAGTLLTVLVVAVMIAGPILGTLVGRNPWHRSSLVIGIVSAIVMIWTVVLLWPGQSPMWLLVLLVVIVGTGGPASMIGFDYVRSFNPSHRLGTATGIVNQAGFVASLILVVSIGLILDWRTPGASTRYTPEAFRWAMSSQYILWAVGLTQILRYRRKTRLLLIAEGSA